LGSQFILCCKYLKIPLNSIREIEMWLQIFSNLNNNKILLLRHTVKFFSIVTICHLFYIYTQKLTVNAIALHNCNKFVTKLVHVK